MVFKIHWRKPSKQAPIIATLFSHEIEHWASKDSARYLGNLISEWFHMADLNFENH